MFILFKKLIIKGFQSIEYEEDDVSLSANDDRDYICVNCGSNTFEYWVSLLIVE